jgi:sterol desaturase/sphingolipid hydroxylase (fatty acid hydroxylase superfamily)
LHLVPAVLVDIIRRKLTVPDVLVVLLLLLSALISACICYCRTTRADRSLRGLFAFAFPLEILCHRSARADLFFWITRKIMMFILLMPVTISSVATIGYLTQAALTRCLSIERNPSEAAGPVTIVVFTFTMLLVYDLSYYFYHRMQHRFAILWELHKVHHSAEVMVGITKDRVHPLDEVMSRLWDGLLPGIVYGVWLLVALDPVELTIFGINVYVMRSILMMDLIRHTHLKISFGPWLNRVILCPHYHQLHHSIDPRHYNKNFGLMLPVWDRMFGTLAVPTPNESFAFGLADEEHVEYHSLFGLYVLPVRKMLQHLVRPELPSLGSMRAERPRRLGHPRGEVQLQLSPPLGDGEPALEQHAARLIGQRRP